MSPQEKPVILTTPQEKKSRGSLLIQHWDQKQRTQRALKIFGICWGLAIVSILIPLAHFLLVPAFLLAGPVAAFVVYQNQETIVGGTGDCPNCQKPFAVARGSVKWPFNDLCAACQTPVSITPE